MATQSWGVSADGGYLANPKLSKTIRIAAQPMMKFRPYTRIEPGLGKNRGDTLNFNKLSNVQTAGGTISELNRIPETKILVRRGTLTITEYGNSIPYTGKLETLSEFDTSNLWTVGLRNDMAKVLDSAVATAFKTSDVIFQPTSSTVGVFAATKTTTALSNITIFHVKDIVDSMKVGSFGALGSSFTPVPPWDGENYVAIAAVKALRGLKDDPDFETPVKYADPERLLTGEVGRFYGTRFVESNHTLALSNGVGSGSVLGEMVFFGADPVIESVAVPEEVRAKIPQDYGRDKGIAWYFLGGFQLTWSGATDGEQHVVYVTSA